MFYLWDHLKYTPIYLNLPSGSKIRGIQNRKSLQRRGLRFFFSDYERVNRVFGPEQVEAAVEADKQREQAEKGRKRPRRSLDRGGR